MFPSEAEAQQDQWRLRQDFPKTRVEAKEERPGSFWFRVQKRLFDLVAATVLLVLTSPLLLLGALLVKLTSRGPALYCQTRLGRGGRPYTILKLRTMYHNCERTSGARWATVNDPRVTPIGRFLRRTHLDELPQLLNVLLGHMSLVGPRPERPEFVSKLEQSLPAYRERLLVRPGVTGLAQVQLPPDSDLVSVRRKLAHDLYYIRAQSFWLDAKILLGTLLYLLRTPVNVLRRLLRLPGGEPVEIAYEERVLKVPTQSPHVQLTPQPSVGG
jgi:lipopolysaccharide/colanic/teichoic acid biosynthesis glycosyltransferase